MIYIALILHFFDKLVQLIEHELVSLNTYDDRLEMCYNGVAVVVDRDCKHCILFGLGLLSFVIFYVVAGYAENLLFFDMVLCFSCRFKAIQAAFERLY